jgi:hypothetical protein
MVFPMINVLYIYIISRSLYTVSNMAIILLVLLLLLLLLLIWNVTQYHSCPRTRWPMFISGGSDSFLCLHVNAVTTVHTASLTPNGQRQFFSIKELIRELNDYLSTSQTKPKTFYRPWALVNYSSSSRGCEKRRLQQLILYDNNYQHQQKHNYFFIKTYTTLLALFIIIVYINRIISIYRTTFLNNTTTNSIIHAHIKTHVLTILTIHINILNILDAF